MKPTRNIVKPNTGLWNAKGKVWYQKNEDGFPEKYKDLNPEQKTNLKEFKKEMNKLFPKYQKISTENFYENSYEKVGVV